MVKIGTAVVTVIILILWLINLRYFWQTDTPSAPRQELTTLREDMNRALEGVQDQINRLKTNDDEARGSEFVESLKDEITRPRSNGDDYSIPTPVESEPYGSTPPDQKVRSSCPAFINCMPTFDSAPRSCVVPPGCEDETIIAY
jgi:hypothetical protein